MRQSKTLNSLQRHALYIFTIFRHESLYLLALSVYTVFSLNCVIFHTQTNNRPPGFYDAVLHQILAALLCILHHIWHLHTL